MNILKEDQSKLFGFGYKKIMQLIFNYYEYHMIASEHCVIKWKQIMGSDQHWI